MLATGIVDPKKRSVVQSQVLVLLVMLEVGFAVFSTAFDNLIENAERWQWFTEATFQISDTTTLSAELLLTDSDVLTGEHPYLPNRLVDESRTIRVNNPGLIDNGYKYPDIWGAYASCDEAIVVGPGMGAQDAAGIPIDWQSRLVLWAHLWPGRATAQLPSAPELMRFAAALDGRGDYFWQTSVSYSKSERQSAAATMVYRDIRAGQGLGQNARQLFLMSTMPMEPVFSLETLQAHAGQGPCQYGFLSLTRWLDQMSLY